MLLGHSSDNMIHGGGRVFPLEKRRDFNINTKFFNIGKINLNSFAYFSAVLKLYITCYQKNDELM